MEEKPAGRICDLGCGYGVIAVILAGLCEDNTVFACDINSRAVELTGLNAENNGVKVGTFIADGLAGCQEMFDVVVTNPPVRAGKKVIYRLIEEAYGHLVSGGFFYAVIRKNQGALSYARKAEEIFGSCRIIARKAGYLVLKSNR